LNTGFCAAFYFKLSVFCPLAFPNAAILDYTPAASPPLPVFAGVTRFACFLCGFFKHWYLCAHCFSFAGNLKKSLLSNLAPRHVLADL
jgi:hypothetical protein